jgi:hypothetical protein
MIRNLHLLILATQFGILTGPLCAHPPAPLEWDSPSTDAKGSMPIGNGDIGANVWVEPSGDLVLLVGKTDAWDENMRLLKLGKVRYKLTPALYQPGGPFKQTLDLARGRCIIQTAAAEVCVWVDANHPVIQIDAKTLSGQPLSATASVEIWRTEKRQLPVGEQGYPAAYQPVYSWPDTVLPPAAHQIGWYHRNSISSWAESLKLQKLDAMIDQQVDPILNRTTGAILRGENWVSASATELRAEKPADRLSLCIYPLTRITGTADAWISAIEKQADAVDSVPVAQRQKSHEKWWDAFWKRSWIFMDGDAQAQTVTRGYTLQRWIHACGGRGAYPIKFNGSIFVVEDSDRRGFDSDFRAWGGAYWFQNTRLIYWSMLTAGDFDLMQPFFNLYLGVLPTRTLATRTYYGHDGAFFPETMTIWGTYQDRNYGVSRKGKPAGRTDNPFIRSYWQGGIEMVALMLDYFDLTQDREFRDTTLIPFATEILTFFDQHWKRGSDGKILFHPAQSLETWFDSTNPTPEIAGLRYIIPRLQQATTDARLRAVWQNTLDDLPPVPTGKDAKTGMTLILPADKFAVPRNVENPELYAVFPYRLYTVAADSDALAIAKSAWQRRRHPQGGGWQQNAIQAAMLGLADSTRRYVVQSASTHNRAFRFPAMWGPNYDWTPDQDHGSVLMNALQRMLIQYEGDRILLLPAWPQDWDVSFKLHAPKNTTVECTYRNGEVERLDVSPPSRRKDVTILGRK